MSIFQLHLSKEEPAESGFVLILSLVILLVLSLIGIWAMQTSTFELKIAGSSQQIEAQFNVAEGGANAEAGKIGFNQQDFYQIGDPSVPNQLLTPDTDSAFDPGNDTANVLANIDSGDSSTWPWENIWPIVAERTQPVHNTTDYKYLATYLYPDTPPMGYDTNNFSGYKFRIQGAARIDAPVIVELGGTKVGVRASL